MRCVLLLALGWISLAPSFVADASAADTAAAPARDPAELAIVLLSPEPVFAANFPQADEFSEWLNAALRVCRRELANERKPPGLLVQISLRKNRDPEFAVAGQPRLSRSLSRRLLAGFRELPTLHPAVCDMALRLQTPGQGEHPMDATAFRPRVLTPDAAFDASFIRADLANKRAMIQNWARDHALPLLAHAAANADRALEGASETGRSLVDRSVAEMGSVETALYRRADFWRGVIAMPPGDQLISALPAVLFAAAGEFDRASTLSLLVHFTVEDSLARVVLTRLRVLLDGFQAELAQELERGRELHERGDYRRAIAQFDDVLAAYPGSAQARYDRFLARFLQAGGIPQPDNPASALWDEAAREIYRTNPLFDAQFGATGGRDVGSRFDRLTLRMMTVRPAEDPGERFGTLAEVALHLEDYGPAAQFFWAILQTKYGPKARILPAQQATTLTTNAVLARFLYCLEQLGVTELKNQFQGDFPEEFAALEQELADWRAQ